MLVVSDTSCISYLFQIGKLNLLAGLFKEVAIPQKVFQELTQFHSGDLIPRLQIFNIKTYQVSDISFVENLKSKKIHAGEAEAIALSIELKANILLIDEAEGKREAQKFGLRTIGILGIILLAKEEKLIKDAKPLFLLLKTKTTFYFSEQLYKALLEQASE